MKEKKRGSFSGQLGFILAAAGSAVGLGNIWRFPYLAAKDGGGIFIVVYVVLALTFGFTLLTTEVAIGRKTKQSPLTAYKQINSKFGFIGVLACLVPVIILPYYCTIGGWVLKYFELYITGHGSAAVADGFFTGYITGQWEPIIWMLIYFLITAFIVISGVEKGIEKYSRILMPILVILVIGISLFSLTLSYTDVDGITRTGLDGLKVYLIPNISGMGIRDFFIVVMDAMGQLFYSISVCMGIMIAYGSYVPKEANLMKSINQIEIFDTIIALFAGLMIIPAIFVFMGMDGMSSGPGLVFISLPKVFASMGFVGNIIGIAFFTIMSFAAVTSSVSVMEAIVSSMIDKYNMPRKKASYLVSLYALVFGVIVCLGYNKFYFEFLLPNGTVGQILDIMDYVSNNLMMPIVGVFTAILIGWVVKPDIIIEEVTEGKYKFGRQRLYVVMIRYIVPILLVLLLLKAVNVF